MKRLYAPLKFSRRRQRNVGSGAKELCTCMAAEPVLWTPCRMFHKGEGPLGAKSPVQEGLWSAVPLLKM